MAFFSVIFALLLEQLKPFTVRRRWARPLNRAARWLRYHLEAGESQHGTFAWAVAVLLPCAAVALLYWAAKTLHPLLALLVNVAVLYLGMGFRQFSHHFSDMRRALELGDLPRAHALADEWRDDDGVPHAPDDLTAIALARVAVERALADSHRYVFGVLLWFMLLPGPVGVVLYRMAFFLRNQWAAPDAPTTPFGTFAAKAFALIDWLPQHATALVFAVMGSFEDAVYCWRTQSTKWRDASIATVIAAGAGAIRVKLGQVGAAEGGSSDEVGVGEEADIGSLAATVGLVWRALFLWLFALLLMGFAVWVG
jgi:adenosylcobinamide-phosphate synthase